MADYAESKVMNGTMENNTKSSLHTKTGLNSLGEAEFNDSVTIPGDSASSTTPNNIQLNNKSECSDNFDRSITMTKESNNTFPESVSQVKGSKIANMDGVSNQSISERSGCKFAESNGILADSSPEKSNIKATQSNNVSSTCDKTSSDVQAKYATKDASLRLPEENLVSTVETNSCSQSTDLMKSTKGLNGSKQVRTDGKKNLTNDAENSKERVIATNITSVNEAGDAKINEKKISKDKDNGPLAEVKSSACSENPCKKMAADGDGPAAEGTNNQIDSRKVDCNSEETLVPFPSGKNCHGNISGSTELTDVSDDTSISASQNDLSSASSDGVSVVLNVKSTAPEVVQPGIVCKPEDIQKLDEGAGILGSLELEMAGKGGTMAAADCNKAAAYDNKDAAYVAANSITSAAKAVPSNANSVISAPVTTNPHVATGEAMEPQIHEMTSSGYIVVDETVTEEQRHEMLKSQLKYYFSLENLSRDKYMKSQMDDEQYIRVEVLAQFNLVRQLTSSIDLIVDILQEISSIEVDSSGEVVRARARPASHQRSALILREIPRSTPVQDVEALFIGDGCPRPVSVEFAHNDNWYVTFESEGDGHKAYRHLREVVQTFLGKPIMARIKMTPPLARSGFSTQSRATPQLCVPPPQMCLAAPQFPLPYQSVAVLPESTTAVDTTAEVAAVPLTQLPTTVTNAPSADDSSLAMSTSPGEVESLSTLAYNSVPGGNLTYAATSAPPQQSFPFFPPPQLFNPMWNPYLMDPNLMNYSFTEAYAAHMAACQAVDPATAAAFIAAFRQFPQGNNNMVAGGALSNSLGLSMPHGNNRHRRNHRHGDEMGSISPRSTGSARGYENRGGYPPKRGGMGESNSRQAASAPRFARLLGATFNAQNGAMVNNDSRNHSATNRDDFRSERESDINRPSSSTTQLNDAIAPASQEAGRYSRGGGSSARGGTTPGRRYGESIRAGVADSGSNSGGQRELRERRGGGGYRGRDRDGPGSRRRNNLSDDQNSRTSDTSRRTKDRSSTSESDTSFHLEANAFPPLPAASATADTNTALTTNHSPDVGTQSSIFSPWSHAEPVLRLDNKMVIKATKDSQDSDWPVSSTNKNNPLTNGTLAFGAGRGVSPSDGRAGDRGCMVNGSWTDSGESQDSTTTHHRGRISADSVAASTSSKMNRSTSMENLVAEIASLTADDEDVESNKQAQCSSSEVSSLSRLSYAQMARLHKEPKNTGSTAQPTEPSTTAPATSSTNTSSQISRHTGTRWSTRMRANHHRSRFNNDVASDGTGSANKEPSCTSSDDTAHNDDNEEADGWQVVGKVEAKHNGSTAFRGRYMRKGSLVKEGVVAAE